MWVGPNSIAPGYTDTPLRQEVPCSPVVFQLACFCLQRPVAWLTQHWPLSVMSHLPGVHPPASVSAAPCCSLRAAGLSLCWCMEGLCPFVQGMTDRQSWLSALGSMAGS